MEAAQPRPLLQRLFKPAVTVVAFVALLFGLNRLLTSFDYDEVVAGFDALPGTEIGLMLAALIAQYAMYVAREVFAVGYAGRSELGLSRTALAALISRSLSTLGIATITGFALRLRLYEAFGLRKSDVGQITVYNESTYYIGLLATCAVVLSAGDLPPMVGTAIELPPTRLLGLVAIGLLAGYLVWSLRRRQPLTIRSFSLPVMRGRPLAAQLVLPVADAFVAGAIVWLCLPPGAGLSYLHTTTICVVASIAGSLSQVPGGLGVFEASVLAFVPPAAHPATLAALLVRRAVVNLVPIAVGAILLVAFELSRRVARREPTVGSPLVPTALAAWTFTAGVLLLIAAAVPSPRGPIGDAGPLAQVAVFAIGGATLAAARGLYRHSHDAWVAALLLAALRATLAVAAGPHWTVFSLAMVSVVLLAASRKSFDDQAPVEEVAGEEAILWWTAVIIALIGTVWIAVAHPSTAGRLAVARTAGILAAFSLLVGVLVIRARLHRRRALRAAARAAGEALRAAEL